MKAIAAMTRPIILNTPNDDSATASRLSRAGKLQSPYAKAVDYQPQVTGIYDG
jgi:hypothetical protein